MLFDPNPSLTLPAAPSPAVVAAAVGRDTPPTDCIGCWTMVGAIIFGADAEAGAAEFSVDGLGEEEKNCLVGREYWGLL